MKQSHIIAIMPMLGAAVVMGIAGCSVTPGDSAPGATQAGATTPAETSADPTVPDETAPVLTAPVDSSEGSSDATVDDAAVCSELQIVLDLAAEVSESVAAIPPSAFTDPTSETAQALIDVADELADGLPGLLDAYEGAAAAAPPEIAADLRLVADGTSVLTPMLAAEIRRSAETGEAIDFIGALSEPDAQTAAQEAGLASLRLDDYTNPTCGFRFSNS